MSRKKILVLTASHLCRNPRVVKEAATLGSAGYDVTVMSVSVQQRFERMDLDLMRDQPFTRKVIDYAAESGVTQVRDFLQRGATWRPGCSAGLSRSNSRNRSARRPRCCASPAPSRPI